MNENERYCVVLFGIDRKEVWSFSEFHEYMCRCIYPTAKRVSDFFNSKKEAEEALSKIDFAKEQREWI